MKPQVQTFALTKRYKNTVAVNGVSITINKGDIYGLIGKNGAGKTTLMRMLLDMTSPTSGHYVYCSDRKDAKFRRKIGAIIESPAIYKSCTAYENMRRYAMLFGGTKEDIDRILNLVGLENVKKKKAGEFSLGMKQRLGIGIALLGDPEFLILDEPVNGLDPLGIMEIRNLILKLSKEYNTTFLISSHLLDELAKIATKYAILDQGRLVEEISADALCMRCKKKLVFHVDDAKKASAILCEIVDQEDIVIADGCVKLFSHIHESAQMNKLLCDNGVQVSQIEIHAETLEQYFMGKVGR